VCAAVQIHKLASIYRLKSSSQGSGKRRFTVVTRTRHTSLPTGIDKDRLLFMLGQGAEVGMPDSSRAMTSKGHKMVKKSNGAALQASQIMQLSLSRQRSHKHYKNDQSEGSSQQQKHKMKPSGHGRRSTEKRGQGTTAYASKPMSFVSSGIIRSQEENPSLVVTSCFPLGSHALGITEKGERSSKEAAGLTEIKDIAVVASAIGTFEAHTRGFGSRMMSKMGFQEGQGLGKDGQGIASPVEAVKRPKSLGLGAYAATT
jgi:G patch domain-containing protein 2